jgi:hypothetical protein
MPKTVQKKVTPDKNKKPPVMNIPILVSIMIFYFIVISMSTYVGYNYGKENDMTVLGFSAGFCLSSIICIILWMRGGRKMAGVCW